MENWNYYTLLNPPTCGTFIIQVECTIETIRYCGFEWWNNCVQCWFPKWFWMVRSANTKPCLDTFQIVVQLVQNLVWILLSGESMDPLKPFEWIWMVGTACYQHCSNGITMCVQNQWAFLKVEILNGFKWSVSRRVKVVLNKKEIAKMIFMDLHSCSFLLCP